MLHKLVMVRASFTGLLLNFVAEMVLSKLVMVIELFRFVT